MKMPVRMFLKDRNTTYIVVLGLLFVLSVCFIRSQLASLPERIKEGSPHGRKPISSTQIKTYEQGYSNADDQEFLNFVRDRWVIGPPATGVNPSLSEQGSHRLDHSQVGQSSFLDRLMSERRNGFFVECGAADGETFSNTLFLEKHRSWTGLLVEPNAALYRTLLAKNRRVFSINSCLSTSTRTETTRFTALGLFGGISDKMEETHMRYVRKRRADACDVTVTCFPLYVLLRALRVDHVDYFSLDVEGPELDILKTIPFHKVTIDFLSIEYRVSDMKSIDQLSSSRKLRSIRDFFSRLGGYAEIAILPWNTKVTNNTLNEAEGLDVIFQRIVLGTARMMLTQ